MVEVIDLDQARAWKAAASVLDPEVPAVTVADLGILRSVEVTDGVATAKVTPTYSGCPAVLAIELAVEAAVAAAPEVPVAQAPTAGLAAVAAELLNCLLPAE